MQFKNISYEELIAVLKELPRDQLSKIKYDLEKFSIVYNHDSGFKEFLLNGPIMSDAQYKKFKKNRNDFNQWRR